MKLPAKFEEITSSYLGEEWAEYVASYDEAGYFGLRSNPLKIKGTEFLKFCPYAYSKVDWCDTGYYYDANQVQPAKYPYYHAGLYYIQEPSAMLPASLLPVEPGDKVLDLCAAPGGKSTQIAGKLMGEGLLVSNDISVSRAKALVKNLEMAGMDCAVVTSEKPEKLAKVFKGFFDKVLVDAPCSGEGMFRRQPQMMKDWEDKGPDFYSEIQKDILDSAVRMLAPGGNLVYSTCTFSPEEDEAVIAWILDQYEDLSVVEAFDFPGRDHGHPEWIGSEKEELKYAYRMWPHKIHGEGHFAILLEKADGKAGKVKAAKGSKKMPKEAESFLKDVNLNTDGRVFQVIKDKVYLVPDVMPELKGIRVVRSGLYLGDIKKNRFEPSQSLAMALTKEDYPRIVDLSIDDERVIKYLKCETLMVDGPQGWVLVCVDGFPLGWGKLSRGQLKNKYAAAWRWI